MDGSVHDEKEQKRYDEARTKDLKRMGIEVLRFTNSEAEKKMGDVLKRIKEFVNKDDKI